MNNKVPKIILEIITQEDFSYILLENLLNSINMYCTDDTEFISNHTIDDNLKRNEFSFELLIVVEF